MAELETKTFWDHLDDLRKTLIRVVAVYFVLSLALFFFKEFLFDDIVLAPSNKDFFFYRLAHIDFNLSLINIEVVSQFMIHMKVTLISAFIVMIPYIIYEIWLFIAPALYVNEKRAIGGAFLFASVLFYLGLAVGYFIIFPVMLSFFVNYQVSAVVPNMFSLSSYMSLLTSTVLMFGLIFEFPSVVAVLSALGVVSRQMLRKYRRHAICGVVILAALITPSGDPFSLFVVCIPLYLLYEFSILICRKQADNDVNTDEGEDAE